MSPKNAVIQFHVQYHPFTLKNRTALKSYLIGLFQKEGKQADHINYIFCDDRFLLEINKKYLNHDTYTDIISFPYSEPGNSISGDIFISVERVRENAQKYNTSFSSELLRVIFHGALHFVGYNDKTAAEKKLMREKEDYYLQQYF